VYDGKKFSLNGFAGDRTKLFGRNATFRLNVSNLFEEKRLCHDRQGHGRGRVAQCPFLPAAPFVPFDDYDGFLSGLKHRDGSPFAIRNRRRRSAAFRVNAPRA